jgi:hypothetical protein
MDHTRTAAIVEARVNAVKHTIIMLLSRYSVCSKVEVDVIKAMQWLDMLESLFEFAGARHGETGDWILADAIDADYKFIVETFQKILRGVNGESIVGYNLLDCMQKITDEDDQGLIGELVQEIVILLDCYEALEKIKRENEGKEKVE